MKTILKGVILSMALCAPAAVMADPGGVPNAAACNPGNAVFCPDRQDGSSSAQVPELDAAGLPLALGLTATLVMWGRERRRNKR